MDINKLTRTAGNLDTLAKVASVMCKSMAVVCLVFSVLVGIFGEKMLTSTAMSLDLDFIKIHLSEAYTAFTPMVKLHMVAMMVSATVALWLFGWGMSLVRKVLAPMKQGSPFEEHIPGVLRKIAWLIIIGGTVTEALGIINKALTMKTFPMEEIFSSPAVDHIETILVFDLKYVILGCVILFLSYVFQYGRMLQVESDETL